MLTRLEVRDLAKAIAIITLSLLAILTIAVGTLG